MAKFTVGIVGCGRPLRTEGATGFGMSHRHMVAYKATEVCELLAVADISRENAEAFVAEHNPEARIFASAEEMMEKAKPDIVSVCLWPHLHAQVVEAIAPYRPKAIYCEKPMDIHWDACLRMKKACDDNGVKLLINHQRRFNKPLLEAKALIDEGRIGKVQRMEGAWQNMFDNGTHVVDMLFYFNGDVEAEWVMGQIEPRGGRPAFGAVQAGQGMIDIRFKNGVRARYYAGKDHEDQGALVRIYGESGQLEILYKEPWMRHIRQGDADWTNYQGEESIHGDTGINRAVADFVACIESGNTALISADYGIRTTEVLFAAQESARRRGRVDLPLPPMKSPLLEMLERKEIPPCE